MTNPKPKVWRHLKAWEITDKVQRFDGNRFADIEFIEIQALHALERERDELTKSIILATDKVAEQATRASQAEFERDELKAKLKKADEIIQANMGSSLNEVLSWRTGHGDE